MGAGWKVLMGGCVVMGLLPVWGQAPLLQEPGTGRVKVEAVAYLYPEQVTLPAGKAGTVELHFRVAPGLHINSHNPSDKFLIPTAFSVPEGAGVRLVSAEYPAGAEFVLPADPTMKLSVFTGEFAIQARLMASAGDHLVEARLRYQACDEAQCMPPKTITVPIDVVGK